ncbi:MAG: hypothetical protein MUE85_03395 [Microscillaceae bacterium]|nr:hypothetical protein [Microscillaceae bacterium]
MNTNISQKEQKDKLFALNKEAFVAALLSARPQDYQERNWFYHVLSVVISYPLQFISILAGAYLLFDIARFVWQLDVYSAGGTAILGLCFLIFFSIESLRRWLVNTAGYHYLATFRIQNGQMMAGEWLVTKVYILAFISLVLISSGTTGTYLYIKHSAPEAKTIDIQQVTSPLVQKTQQERQSLTRLDKDIQNLMNAKKTELADYKSYQVWQGKEYLLPEVKERHTNYDKQIAEMNRQRQLHQKQLANFEDRLNHKEQKTEAENEKIIGENQLSKETYAAISAGIWLVFEILLVFMLSYSWVYKLGVKREVLLNQVEWQAQNADNQKVKNYNPKVQNFNAPQTSGFQFFQNEADDMAVESQQSTVDQSKTIGFEKWYEKPRPSQKETANHPSQSLPETSKELPQIVIKEVPVFKEIYIEREVPVEVIKTQVIDNEGFMVTCSHCGKTEHKKRPAKFCSDGCRNRAWKEKKLSAIA